MKFIKQSTRPGPKVSLILLDWSVRESFHLLHYLSKQDVDRDLFEVIIIEYYSQVSDAIRPFEDHVDSWLLLEMPEACYYHKHLMYNAGIVAAQGDICVICDSDAIVKPGFIRSIITEFENHPNTVLHIDQFRNARKDLYPFCYPDFSEVTGRGCINNIGGKTRGVVDDKDPIHNRKVMLFDEITSALDPELVGGILAILQDLARQRLMTMLIVTHHMKFAERCSDRVLFFEQGKIHEDGPPQKLFRTPAEERTREFLKAVLAD